VVLSAGDDLQVDTMMKLHHCVWRSLDMYSAALSGNTNEVIDDPFGL